MYSGIYLLAHGRSGGTCIQRWIVANSHGNPTYPPKHGVRCLFKLRRRNCVARCTLPYNLDEYQRYKKKYGDPRGGDIRIAYVIRDPFNWFASSMKHLRGEPDTTPEYGVFTMRRLVEGYKELCREYLGLTHILPDNALPIIYNRWFAENDYRLELAKELQLRTHYKGMESVPKAAGGSSFDGKSFDGRASEMKVTERWKHFRGDGFYKSLFDDELLELTKPIFGPPPKKLNLRRSSRS